MLHAFADRFLATRADTWIDIATGEAVRLLVQSAGRETEQIARADRCGTLAALRHPLLNPLLDYGCVGPSSWFEAYAAGRDIRTPPAAAPGLVTHAVRFLSSHAVPLTRAFADYALRPIRKGPAIRTRAVGVVLQSRAAARALTDALDAAGPPGSTAVDVIGDHLMGLRTLLVATAREARVRGYVPLSLSVLAQWPAVGQLVLDRHVCVLAQESDGEAERRALAAFVARLGAASARRHLVFRFRREAGGGVPAVRLEPMGVAAMTGMVFVDEDFGPEMEELFSAARRADGRPGRFLEHLRAWTVAAPRHAPMLLHEAAVPYRTGRDASNSHALASAPARRLAGAEHRALALAGRGRHAAAVRLLTRASRVLEGRERRESAGACAAAAGWLLRARGLSAAAIAMFERARGLAVEHDLCLVAAGGLAACWIDDGRAVEAEAAMRSAAVAAQAVDDAEGFLTAQLGLARALYYQKRLSEASVALAPVLESNVRFPDAINGWALSSRLRRADDDIGGALRAAREALVRAASGAAPRRRATAHRAMAAALSAAGDLPGVRRHAREGIAAAAEARLPLAALRLRATLLEALRATSPDPPETRQLAGRLSAALKRRLPRLVAAEIASACDAGLGRQALHGRPAAPSGLAGENSVRPAEELEHLLEICHRAPDDRTAVDAVCRAVCDALQAASVVITGGAPEHRVVAAAGRPWHAPASVAARVLGSGITVGPDRTAAPMEAAEPVRCGDHVLAALACRWIAGTDVESARVTRVLRAGALAAAGSVRAILESALPDVPASAWGELLGGSPAASMLRDTVVRAARAPFPVLIEGESGSGKELVARAIHRLGPRRDRRFCAINCAAIADELIEAELFGHVRGAFTGAVAERPGLFEEADGGTLFLDEIGELSTRAQAKLLRVLQEGEVRRVGENLPRRVDARVVAATNRRLADEAAAGRFRADLRFRLDVIRIEVPPLRERVPDIPILAARFWSDAAARVGSRATLAPEALGALSRYDWPGNVRELQNVIASMAVQSPRRGRIGPADLPARLAAAASTGGSFDTAREEFERRFVRAALARAGGRRGRAAAELGVSRQGLAKMLRRLRIETS
jgi:DNA-binding NtrC family response regulator/tetratricopeptide (TPR) repeat protein